MSITTKAFINMFARDQALSTHPRLNDGLAVEAATPGRFTIVENFQMIPRLADTLYNLNGTFADAEAEKAILANREFELSGTNAVNTCATRSASGGITLTTTTGSGDSVVLSPLSEATVKADGGAGATYTSAMQATEWDTSKSPCCRWSIITGPSLVSLQLGAGLKFTANIETENDDSASFYVATTAGGVGTIYANTNASATESSTSTGVVVAASTSYVLDIYVDAARYAHYAIGTVESGALRYRSITKSLIPLTASITTLKPHLIYQTDSAAAKSVTVRQCATSRWF